MAEIINLNKARKARAKAQGKATASTNRAKHGQSESAKSAEKRRQEKTEQLLDGAKIEKDD